MFGTAVKVEAGDNPFVGPRPFETGRKIFGRNREIDDLYYLLSGKRIVLLYSPSGAGKSSLIQAGLVPRMRKRFEVWGPTRVNQSLESQSDGVNRYVRSALLGFEQTALAGHRRNKPEELAKMTLSQYVAGRREKAQNIVVIFDQFEEVLTADPLAIEAKREFFEQLGDLLLDPHVWALFALREDYLAMLDPYAELVPTHLKNGFRLDLLRQDSARDAVTSTVAEGGRRIEVTAVSKLVNDLATIKVQQQDGTFVKQVGLYVEPLQLQVVCRGLWERMPEGKQTIDLADIEQFGDVTDALSSYYASEVARISEGDLKIERTIREWIGERLITANGIRRQTLRGAGSSEGLNNEFVVNLVNTHLVRGEQRDGATWYELAHDRLIEPVRINNLNWIETHLHKVQKDAAAWEAQGRPTSRLLLGADLAEAERWAAQNESSLTDIEHKFLEASAAQERQTAMRRRLAITSGIIALVAVAAIGMAYVALRKAREATDSANIATREAAEQKGIADAATIKAQEGQAKANAALQRAEFQAEFAEQQTEAANAATAEARRQRESADQIAYVANMSLAGAESAQGNRQRVFQLLEAYLPPDNSSRSQINLLDAYLPGYNSPLNQSHLRSFYWHYLWRQNVRDLVLDNEVHHLSVLLTFSPDGKILVRSTANSSARWWDVHSRKELPSPNKQTIFGESLAFSPDGRMLAGRNFVWDLQLRKNVFTFLHEGYVHALAFSPKRPILASASTDYTVKLWNIEDRKEIITLKGLFVKSLAFSHDGQTLVITGFDGDVKLWNMQNLKEAPVTLFNPGIQVNGVVVSHDGETVATSSNDKMVRLWDIRSRNNLTLGGNEYLVDSMAFSPNGTTLAIGRDYGKIQLWDVPSRKILLTLSAHEKNVESLAFSPSGRILASASVDGTIRFWDLQSRSESRLLRGHEGDVLSLAFSPNGQALASGGKDNKIMLWDMQTSGKPAMLGKHEKPVNSIAFSPNGHLLASASDDQSIKLWDVQKTKNDRTLGQHNGAVNSVAFSTDGRTVLSAGDDKNIKLWDLQGHPAFIFNDHESAFNSAVFSPDKQTLASVSADGAVKLWSVKSRSEIAFMNKRSERIISVAFSPNGQILASINEGQSITLWDVQSRQEITILRGHTRTCASLAFSPDGWTLATGGYDKTIKLWDLRSYKEIATLSINAGAVRALAFSPDGRTLASGYNDGTIQLWTGATDQDIEAFLPKLKTQKTHR